MSRSALLEGYLLLWKCSSKPGDTMPEAGRYFQQVMDDLLKTDPKMHGEVMKKIKKG